MTGSLSEKAPSTSRPLPEARKPLRSVRLIYWVGQFLVFGALLAIYFAGDRTWWGTALLFGPRWIWGVPLAVAVLTAFWMGRLERGLAMLAMGGFLFLILGFNLPLTNLLGSRDSALRFMTLNVGIDPIRWTEFARLLEEQHVDVVVLQECRNLPEGYLPHNWQTINAGELVIATRYPITESAVVTRLLSHRYPRPIVLIGTVVSPAGTFPLATLHMLSPSQGLQQLLSAQTLIDLSRKETLEQETIWRWAENEHASAELKRYPEDLIIAGDFNTPVESPIFRKAWGRYGNAFSQAGFGCGGTVTFQRRNIHFSSRIDHVLLGSNWRCCAAWVGPDLGSDHRPVIADLQRLSRQ